MIKKKILFVSVSRSDYGIMSNLIALMSKDKKNEVSILISGNHFSPIHGSSITEIIKKNRIKFIKFLYKKKISEYKDTSKYIQSKLAFLNKKLKNKFHLVIILGDRFELIPVATFCYLNRVNLAHIHGGETTLGSFDNKIRDVLTKFSNFHFPATNLAAKKIKSLGEKNIFNIGSLSLDNIKKKIFFYNKNKIEKKFNFKLGKKNILVTFHPETNLEIEKTIKNLTILLTFLKTKLNYYKIIFTGVNNDPINILFYKKIKEFCKNYNQVYIPNFGYDYYLSLLKIVDLLIGNSSSGIIECPFFRKSSINIGVRQLKREASKYVINSESKINSIKKSFLLFEARKEKKFNFQNPYFKKNSAEKFNSIISKLNLNKYYI